MERMITMRLIDADLLRKESKMLYSIHAFEPVEAYTQDQIDNAPTIDLVPAPVKCGECKYYDTDECRMTGTCDGCDCEINLSFNSTGFCSYGERKEII
jgi:hypothetical protein